MTWSYDQLIAGVVVVWMAYEYSPLITYAKMNPNWATITRAVVIYALIIFVPIATLIGFVIAKITMPALMEMSKKEEQ